MVGYFIVKKISKGIYYKLFIKYYSFSFAASTFLIIIVHFAYLFDGSIYGLPLSGSLNTDSLVYIDAAKNILNNGYNYTATYYDISGALTYVYIIVFQFAMWGINPLIVVLFNALLYSLSIIVFGKYASYYVDYKTVNRLLLFIVLYFSFFSYTVVPLKESLILFLGALFMLQTHYVKEKYSIKNVILLLIVGIFLTFSRMYIGIILLICSIAVVLLNMRIRNIIITLLLSAFIIISIPNISKGYLLISDVFENQHIYLGTWKSTEGLQAIGAKDALDVITSGRLDYLNLIMVQLLNTFFRPFFTSFPRLDLFATQGGYITSLINYLGSFLWYFILPSVVYGLYHGIRNRKDMAMIYVPLIAFFIFFIFTRNQLRYQLLMRLFMMLYGAYGYQYYSKWKKYIPLWIGLYLAIAMVTI
jgi:hypothetical protein